MNTGLFIATDEKSKPLKEVLRKYKPNQVFKPGEVATYSNYGISLAGYIIERIYGKPYYESVQENIFKPLRMRNSTFKQGSTLAPIVSKGYGIDGKERRPIHT
ncbi:hypothetical protein Ctaglu_00740 [Clostridium tagluense]|uniref:Beta-lactamase-related domain-containing protein n=1 Tax=Clostridium tagluense TaxID=360422 RepID=A0A401UFW8_9CLOT|nr:hypothetical protein Ctaglu_00740 [Clostridium tagluense]